MGSRVYTRCANLHLMVRDGCLRSVGSNGPQGNKNWNTGRGTYAFFGLPDSDNLVSPNGCQLSAITAPGNVRHCVWGRYLDVPWAKCREIWCLTETDDQTVGKRARRRVWCSGRTWIARAAYVVCSGGEGGRCGGGTSSSSLPFVAIRGAPLAIRC